MKAQLSNITAQTGQYGAISNKARHPFGEAKASLDKKHSQAVEQGILILLRGGRDL